VTAVERRLTTAPARGHGDVRSFFDRSAAEYVEQHGNPSRLLRYRLSLLRRAARFQPGDVVLEIGCGDGAHLLALAGELGRGLGIDLSTSMVERARARAAAQGLGQRIRFAADLAERLSSVADASVDVVMCTGSLEHMLDQPAVARAAARVLRPGGRFVGLTLNGGYVWYRRIAPWLGLDVCHLATDHFLRREELKALLTAAGFSAVAITPWTFIPRGDMPPSLARLLAVLDVAGRLTRLPSLRGGLRFRASLGGGEPAGHE
jgi:2-polyprenyl-6-hydroxyphenyl methylase/3-demethylubiquinone-9 3-methyltransferase